MTDQTDRSHEEGLYAGVYIALLALTALTAASSLFRVGPLLAVVFAVAVATMKASLIVYYFMHMKDGSPLIVGILLAGIVAVAVLGVGILPDIAYRL